MVTSAKDDNTEPTRETQSSAVRTRSLRGARLRPARTAGSLAGRVRTSVISDLRARAAAAAPNDDRSGRIDDERDQKEHEARGQQRRELRSRRITEVGGDQRGHSLGARLEDA